MTTTLGELQSFAGFTACMSCFGKCIFSAENFKNVSRNVPKQLRKNSLTLLKQLCKFATLCVNSLILQLQIHQGGLNRKDFF